MFRYFRSEPKANVATPTPGATPAIPAAVPPTAPEKPAGQISAKRVRSIFAVIIVFLVAYFVWAAQREEAAKAAGAKRKASQAQQAQTQSKYVTDWAGQVNETLKARPFNSASSQAPSLNPGTPQWPPVAFPDQQVQSAPYNSPGLPGAPSMPATQYPSSPISPVPSGNPAQAKDPQLEVRNEIEAASYKREVESLSARLIVRSDRLATPGAASTPPGATTNQTVAPSLPPGAPSAPSPTAQQDRPAAFPLPAAGPFAQQPAPPSRTTAAAGQNTSLPADIPNHDSRARRPDQNALNRADGPLYKLFEGTFLETVLTNRLNSSFTGPVECMVTIPAWSHNRTHLLIPQGAKVIGEARRVTAIGQQRIAVLFHRLIMPDGYSVSLDNFTGLNSIGETGLTDKVNHHYVQIFGVSAALGAISGLAVRGTNYGSASSSGTDAFRQGFAQEMSQEATQILDRFLNILPTVVIREGTRVKVYLVDDVSLPAYDQHKMASDL